MNEQPRSNQEPKEHEDDCQHHGAHANFKRGLSDYNDGANVTDYLGNDDQIIDVGNFNSGTSIADRDIGKVAMGNNVREEHP